MTLQQILSYVRRACDDYHMIQPGDKIAVGVSGGKDSLTTLMAMAALRRFYPIPFSLTAITIDLGFEGGLNTESLAAFCESIDVPFTVVKTDIGSVVFDERGEKNPCSLCAKMRKGVLNGEAIKDHCTRIAYGHNRDDIMHTFFLSLFYEGRIHTLSPVTYLDRTNLYCIRPLMYVPEHDVLGFTRRQSLPVIKSPCPVDGHTKREEIKKLTTEFRKRYSYFDEKVFGAIQHSNMEGWNTK